MVKLEFNKNKDEQDENKIEFLKAGAIRALSNYMLYESGGKDEKLGKAMKKFHDKSTKGMKANDGTDRGSDDCGNQTELWIFIWGFDFQGYNLYEYYSLLTLSSFAPDDHDHEAFGVIPVLWVNFQITLSVLKKSCIWRAK